MTDSAHADAEMIEAAARTAVGEVIGAAAADHLMSIGRNAALTNSCNCTNLPRDAAQTDETSPPEP